MTGCVLVTLFVAAYLTGARRGAGFDARVFDVCGCASLRSIITSSMDRVAMCLSLAVSAFGGVPSASLLADAMDMADGGGASHAARLYVNCDSSEVPLMKRYLTTVECA